MYGQDHRIKNGKELVERAEYHAYFDHIVQGTYGRASVNGKPEFEGCAMACLAAPAGEAKLTKWLRDWATHFWGSEYAEQEHLGGIEPTRDGHEQEIAEQFGIGLELGNMIEAIFEALPTHGAAIEFIPEVASRIAACEGIELTDGELMDWRWENGLYEGSTLGDGRGDYAYEARDLFFEWLEEKAAAPATIG